MTTADHPGEVTSSYEKLGMVEGCEEEGEPRAIHKTEAIRRGIEERETAVHNGVGGSKNFPKFAFYTNPPKTLSLTIINKYN